MTRSTKTTGPIQKVIVMTAKAFMPNMKFGGYAYYKVAVVETDGVNLPKQIHPRHAAVKSIVAIWDRQFRGQTDNCQFGRSLAEAKALAASLNAAG